jgi:hypothetical protein
LDFMGPYRGGGAEAQEGPLWVEQVPGVSGNWWEVASPIQASRNGSIVAYALTSLARYDPLGPKHAEVVVVDRRRWRGTSTCADTWDLLSKSLTHTVRSKIDVAKGTL